MTTPSHRGTRELRRSRSDRVIGGVCGGLGRYFDIDPVLLRVVAVALVFASGSGVLVYLIGWLVIPDDAGEPMTGSQRPPNGLVVWYLGLVLVAVGGVLLLNLLVPWFTLKMLWPLIIIAGGILVLISSLPDRRP